MDNVNREAAKFCRCLFPAFLLSPFLLLTFVSCAFGQDAYVVREWQDNVSVINTQTNEVVGSPIGVGKNPNSIAIAPNGKTAYVVTAGVNPYAEHPKPGEVWVIDTETNEVVGSPIDVGAASSSIAITPNGKTAYVTNLRSNTVSVIDTQTNEVVGAPINVGADPSAIAITPDGKTAYVTNQGAASVTVIDTETNEVVGLPIQVRSTPDAIAITPNGRTAYVVNEESGNLEPGTVSVIDTETNEVVGSPIGIGVTPAGIAISPNGKTAYVVNVNSAEFSYSQGKSISVIETENNRVIDATITLHFPRAIAIAPNGKSVYVVGNFESGAASIIDPQTNQVVGGPISLGETPIAIAVTPDQPPVASFSASTYARPGSPAHFNASASTYPEGSTPTYEWEFGDGTSEETTSPTTSHTFSAPGTYKAALTVTDDVCSSEFIFTGQTAYCNGSTPIKKTQTVIVTGPASGMSVSLAPDSIIANGSSKTTATAKVSDANGNPVSGEKIAFSSTDGAEQIGPVSEPSEGTYTATITSSPTAGSPTITASDDSVTPKISSHATLTQSAGPAARVSVSLAPDSIIANGSSKTTATAKVSDANGNPVSGEKIAFSSTDGAEQIGPTKALGDGRYEARITSSTSEGSPTITATDYSASPLIQGNAQLVQDLDSPFRLAKVRALLRSGTAKLGVIVPGLGALSLSGASIVNQRVAMVSGPIRLLIVAKGRAARALRETGRERVRITVTFTPIFGTPNTESIDVKLRERG